MIHLVVLSVIWVGCGVLAWGFYQGSHKNSPESWTRPFSLLESVGFVAGPAALFATFVVYGVEFWSWKPITRQERWENHQKKYALLGRTYENFDQ